MRTHFPKQMTMKEKIETLMEQFLAENPYGDSFELAEFMYRKGRESADENV